MSKNNIETIVLHKPNITDYAAARNEELKKSKAEWVLFLDSDEKLSPELQKEITLTINKVPNLVKFGGFYIKRKTYFIGNFVGEDKVLRLATKDSGKWIRAVHEIWDVKTRIGTLQNCIVHNTANNLHDYLNKVNKYALLHSQENKKEGKKSNLYKIVFFPAGKFLITLVKSRNVVFSIMQSFHSFLAWSELWIYQRS